MYEYLIGTITQVFPAYIVVENNGIGYLINVANPFRFKSDETKQEKIYLHQIVRENEIVLYGFSDLQFAEFAAPYYYVLKGQNLFYIEVEGGIYMIKYNELDNLVQNEKVYSWQQNKIESLSEIRRLLRNMQQNFLDLLIG